MDFLHLIEAALALAFGTWATVERKRVARLAAAKVAAAELADLAFHEGLDAMHSAANHAGGKMEDAVAKASVGPGAEMLSRLAMAREAELARAKALAIQTYRDKIAAARVR